MHTTALLLLLTALMSPSAYATIGPMCCGDNFCCALDASRSVTCWGGNSFSAPTGTYKALACYGKGGVAIDDNMQLASCFGEVGYGIEGCTTGATVTDAASSFWGGCSITNDTKALRCWGSPTVYGTNSRPTYADCEAMYGASACGAVTITLTPPSGTFTTVSCGGKRAGHFCCAVATDGSRSCFGAGSTSYTPPSTTSGPGQYMLSCGTDFCCGLTTAGGLECFGTLTQADGSTGTDLPSSLTGPFVSVAAANFASYPLSGNTLSAYGRVFSSDVGPVPAGTSTIAIPSGACYAYNPTNGGFAHSCALSTASAAICWGADYSNQVTNTPSGLIAQADVYVYPAVLTTSASSPTSSPTASSPTSSPTSASLKASRNVLALWGLLAVFYLAR